MIFEIDFVDSIIENIPMIEIDSLIIVTIISMINMWILVLDIIYYFDMMISKMDMELIT